MYGIVSEMDYLPARSCKVIQRFNGYKFAEIPSPKKKKTTVLASEKNSVGGKNTTTPAAVPPPIAAPVTHSLAASSSKTTNSSANTLPPAPNTRSSPRVPPTSTVASSFPPSYPTIMDAGLGVPLSPPRGVRSGTESDASNLESSFSPNTGVGTVLTSARPSTHASLPPQPARPSAMATAKPQPLPAAKLPPAALSSNKLSSPPSSSLGVGAPASRLEAELSRNHEPDNFLTNITSRVPSTSAASGSHGAPSGIVPLDVDELRTDLCFQLGNEDSNSPPPVVSSPVKQAPPAPPGATVSAHGVGISFGVGPGADAGAGLPVTEPKKPQPKPPSSTGQMQKTKTKSAETWASLSAKPMSSTARDNQKSNDVFKLFAKQAQEKKQREAAMQRQEEHRKQLREQAEKERLRREQEKLKEKEENEALNRVVNQRHRQDPFQSMSQTPLDEIKMQAPPVIKPQEKLPSIPPSRDEQRRRERERRQREVGEDIEEVSEDESQLAG